MAAYIWKENILHRKREAFWFSERKGNKRKESRFKKEERNKNERGIFLFVLEKKKKKKIGFPTSVNQWKQYK